MGTEDDTSYREKPHHQPPSSIDTDSNGNHLENTSTSTPDTAAVTPSTGTQIEGQGQPSVTSMLQDAVDISSSEESLAPASSSSYSSTTRGERGEVNRSRGDLRKSSHQSGGNPSSNGSRRSRTADSGRLRSGSFNGGKGYRPASVGSQSSSRESSKSRHGFRANKSEDNGFSRAKNPQSGPKTDLAEPRRNAELPPLHMPPPPLPSHLSNNFHDGTKGVVHPCHAGNTPSCHNGYPTYAPNEPVAGAFFDAHNGTKNGMGPEYLQPRPGFGDAQHHQMGQASYRDQEHQYPYQGYRHSNPAPVFNYPRSNEYNHISTYSNQPRDATPHDVNSSQMPSCYSSWSQANFQSSYENANDQYRRLSSTHSDRTNLHQPCFVDSNYANMRARNEWLRARERFRSSTCRTSESDDAFLSSSHECPTANHHESRHDNDDRCRRHVRHCKASCSDRHGCCCRTSPDVRARRAARAPGHRQERACACHGCSCRQANGSERHKSCRYPSSNSESPSPPCRPPPSDSGKAESNGTTGTDRNEVDNKGFNSQIEEEMARARQMDIPVNLNDKKPENPETPAQSSFVPPSQTFVSTLFDGNGNRFAMVEDKGLCFFLPDSQQVSNPDYVISTSNQGGQSATVPGGEETYPNGVCDEMQRLSLIQDPNLANHDQMAQPQDFMTSQNTATFGDATRQNQFDPTSCGSQRVGGFIHPQSTYYPYPYLTPPSHNGEVNPEAVGMYPPNPYHPTHFQEQPPMPTPSPAPPHTNQTPLHTGFYPAMENPEVMATPSHSQSAPAPHHFHDVMNAPSPMQPLPHLVGFQPFSPYMVQPPSSSPATSLNDPNRTPNQIPTPISPYPPVLVGQPTPNPSTFQPHPPVMNFQVYWTAMDNTPSDPLPPSTKFILPPVDHPVTKVDTDQNSKTTSYQNDLLSHSQKPGGDRCFARHVITKFVSAVKRCERTANFRLSEDELIEKLFNQTTGTLFGVPSQSSEHAASCQELDSTETKVVEEKSDAIRRLDSEGEEEAMSDTNSCDGKLQCSDNSDST